MKKLNFAVKAFALAAAVGGVALTGGLTASADEEVVYSSSVTFSDPTWWTENIVVDGAIDKLIGETDPSSVTKIEFTSDVAFWIGYNTVTGGWYNTTESPYPNSYSLTDILLSAFVDESGENHDPHLKFALSVGDEVDYTISWDVYAEVEPAVEEGEIFAADTSTFPVVPSATYTAADDATSVDITIAYATGGKVEFNDWCGNAIKVTDPDGNVKYYGFGGAQVGWNTSLEEEGDEVVPAAGSDDYFVLDGTGAGTFTIPVVGGSTIAIYDLCWTDVTDEAHYAITLTYNVEKKTEEVATSSDADVAATDDTTTADSTNTTSTDNTGAVSTANTGDATNVAVLAGVAFIALISLAAVSFKKSR